MPKGEKKQLIKFVPSRSLPRDQEIRFSSVLLARQELGGTGHSRPSLCEKPGDPTAKQHQQDRPAHLKPIPNTHTDAFKRMLAKSRPGLQNETAGVKQHSEFRTGR